MYTFKPIYMYIHMYIYLCVYIYTYIHRYIHIHTHIYIYTSIYIYTYMYTYQPVKPNNTLHISVEHAVRIHHLRQHHHWCITTHKSVYIHILNTVKPFYSCMHIYIYTYICIHTYIHTNLSSSATRFTAMSSTPCVSAICDNTTTSLLSNISCPPQ